MPPQTLRPVAAPPFAPTRDRRVSLVALTDPAIDSKASHIERYLESADERHLRLIGEPVRYVFAPPGPVAAEYLVGVQVSAEQAAQVGYACVAVALAAIDTPQPDDPRAISEEDLARRRQVRGGVELLSHRDPLFADTGRFPPGLLAQFGVQVPRVLFASEQLGTRRARGPRRPLPGPGLRALRRTRRASRPPAVGLRRPHPQPDPSAAGPGRRPLSAGALPRGRAELARVGVLGGRGGRFGAFRSARVARAGTDGGGGRPGAGAARARGDAPAGRGGT
ncbi:MAG: hypothetical protein M5U09_13550 [Gammaproteobacteria bacterium]|nr:hypothetical protein [Gammaproteobacteria bacterium]